MKIMKRLFLLLPILAIIIAIPYPVACETKQIIPHKILNKSESGSEKYLLNVQVDLIDGRLPNKTELEELSKYLARKEKKQDSISIHFYLPGTKLGSDAYASVNYKPEKKVKIMKYILFQHLLSK
jgi:hypothetical protein